MTELATFAAGCFWGVEATFAQVPGVSGTRVGYIGGQSANPTYNEVCTDRTGHAEAVEVAYDPANVSYDQLLAIFFENHDPTQLNRQGPDTGSQYRSAIFYHSRAQQAAAEAAKAVLAKSGRFKRPIVTQIVAAPVFYAAEDYHQKYLEKRGLAVCHTN
jgi:peptide-methionine (S)-S-oxide reductase